MEDLEVRQTHLSRLFFTSDRVYKQLKPVDTPFVSFADVDDRIVAATEEFELNYRLAPDVYLGLADVEERGDLADRMIVMRRLPDDRELVHHLAEAGASSPSDAEAILRDVAKHVAAVHLAEPAIEGDDAAMATAHTVRTRWQENFEALEPLAGNVIDAQEFAEVVDLAERYLGGRSVLFAERIDQGWVRDGHGDLRAEHVYCLDDGPRLIDCLAFRRDFRVGDVLNDVAFLAMDLHRLFGPYAAAVLMRYYHEFTNEHHQATLAHHYVAYRAHVRAKIAAIRLSQGDVDAAREARQYHRLARQHLDVGRVRLVLVGGQVGVGKSAVAEGLAAHLGITWLRTDEIRRTTSSGDPSGDSGAPVVTYDRAARDEVYLEMLREARALLTRGESVVMDATWSTDQHREWARELAFQAEAELVEVEVKLPVEEAIERIVIRQRSGDDPSDATPELARDLVALFEPWPEAIAIGNSGPIEASVVQARDVVLGRRSTDIPAGLDVAAQDVADLTWPERRVVVAVGGAEVLNYESIRFYLRRATHLIPSSRD